MSQPEGQKPCLIDQEEKEKLFSDPELPFKETSAPAFKTHELKIADKFYHAVWSGKKTFEVRKDDRNFQVGDHIVFKLCHFSFDQLHLPIWEIARGEWIIIYKLSAADFPDGIKDEYCVLAIKKVDK
jgi:hypothetical protein